MWEDSDSSTPTHSPKLLALSENYELLIYEFDLKDGRCDTAVLHSCSGKTLQKLIEDQDISKYPQMVFPCVEICDVYLCTFIYFMRSFRGNETSEGVCIVQVVATNHTDLLSTSVVVSMNEDVLYMLHTFWVLKT